MRIIAAFLSVAPWLTAQPPVLSNISSTVSDGMLDSLDKQLAAHPDDRPTRVRILNVLTDPNAIAGVSYDRVLEARRGNVLWLIEHDPENRSWIQGEFLIPPQGWYADPAGYAQSVAFWKRLAWRQDARPVVIANAAIYLKATARSDARALLDLALARFPGNPELERALGIVDGAAIAGIDGVDRGRFTTSVERRNSPEAAGARSEVEQSRNAYVFAGAAQMLYAGTIQNAYQLNFGDDDVSSLAERWLRRAIEMAPSINEFKTQLAPVLRAEADRAEDPHDRVRLYSEAMSLTAAQNQPSFLPDLAQAEFEAGDDAAAQRDAGRALDIAREMRNANIAGRLIHRGNIILGRIALAHGDVAEARTRLEASLKLPDVPPDFRSNGPDLSLAQELADAGERDAVIQFLETSRKFWLYDRGRIDHTIRMLKAGKKADAFATYQPSVLEIVNQPAPDFELHDLDGRQWTSGSLDKPAALIFWNAACSSCADQIAQFAKEAASLDMRLLAIDLGDDPARVKTFASTHHLPVPVLFGGDLVAHRYRADTLPSVVVIANGRVSGYQIGAAANPRQFLESGARSLLKPLALRAKATGTKIVLAWRPSPRAESYLIEWEARDAQGWPSDRDGFLRVIATRDAQAELETPGTVRWRVYAVTSGGKSEPTEWQTVESRDLQ